MAFCYVCSGQVEESFSIFFELKHEYWIFLDPCGSIQVCGAAWNHFPTTGTICGFGC
jgi:hypothetical protein